IAFTPLPQPLPPIGELADITVALPALPARPTVPNASLQRVDGQLGVWRVEGDKLQFARVKVLGRDLDGRVQIEGLKTGERVVVYSQRTLSARSHISIVDHIPGVSP
ncbi:MAG TPA: efflux RND transporter periplasmic adaptor subunit, partial [Thiomonas arsenitoxydans]|nr:efflux RND transporter periplasmic adaptor subunit [Thiomonas arsenitoxydans]